MKNVLRDILDHPAKAGVLLYETMPDGKRKFLVPYNEGRFAKNGRYFVLPKGSIDYEDEVEPGAPFDSSPIAGGIRETAEETGFPLREFLGEENIAHLEKGATLRHITNPDFPGFEIVEANPKAHPHTYDARGGKEQTMVMYGFKVKGLESIRPYLKNCANRTTKECLDARPEMPRFPTFLTWMKQGYIPASGDLPRVELVKPKWFKHEVKELAPHGIIEVPDDWQATRENWEAFCAKLEKKSHKEERDVFRNAFAKIKQRLKDEKWIEGDLAVLKFDEKDCPLFYYTEGGVIEDEKTIICKTLQDMVDNPDYARAFGGKGTKKKGLSDAETMVLGQVAAWGSFVRPSMWREALNEVMGATGKTAYGLIEHGQRIRNSAEVKPAPARA